MAVENCAIGGASIKRKGSYHHNVKESYAVLCSGLKQGRLIGLCICVTLSTLACVQTEPAKIIQGPLLGLSNTMVPPDGYTSLPELEKADREASSYRIRRNNIIRIGVYKQSELSLDVRVAYDGTILFPPLGLVKVTGLTEPELVTLLQDSLRGEYLKDPIVTVFIENADEANVVGIFGAVAGGGFLTSSYQMNLVELIMRTGGLLNSASHVAYITHYPDADFLGSISDDAVEMLSDEQVESKLSGAIPSADQIRIDLDGLMLRGEKHWNIHLRSGDIVYIPPIGVIHMTGKGIRRPGTYPLTRGTTTLSQLIDRIGGLKWEAKRKIHVIRDGPNGGRETIQVNYGDLEDDRTKDYNLFAGDRIVFDRNAFKTPLAMIGRAFGGAIGVGVRDGEVTPGAAVGATAAGAGGGGFGSFGGGFRGNSGGGFIR